jgi:hypothetical protein
MDYADKILEVAIDVKVEWERKSSAGRRGGASPLLF